MPLPQWKRKTEEDEEAKASERCLKEMTQLGTVSLRIQPDHTGSCQLEVLLPPVGGSGKHRRYS
jgi:hypothetical protein